MQSPPFRKRGLYLLYLATARPTCRSRKWLGDIQLQIHCATPPPPPPKQLSTRSFIASRTPTPLFAQLPGSDPVCLLVLVYPVPESFRVLREICFRGSGLQGPKRDRWLTNLISLFCIYAGLNPTQQPVSKEPLLKMEATFVPGGYDDYQMPEMYAPSPQR